MRQFIRHPVDIPIEVRQQRSSGLLHTVNVSLGGLAFQSDDEFPVGAIVEMVIPLVSPVFETEARVVWCHARVKGFETGVQFLEADDAYRARMVEQVCYIETYKDAVLKSEGRALSSQEAAMEWISKHAEHFPDSDAAVSVK